jgi:Transposase IS200 like
MAIFGPFQGPSSSHLLCRWSLTSQIYCPYRYRYRDRNRDRNSIQHNPDRQQFLTPKGWPHASPDHVHALFYLSKNHAVKKIVEEVKKGSSKWMKIDGPRNKDFFWQNGYAAFSVSQSNVLDVEAYIENQAKHHRTMTFQDELRALFDRHQIKYDERYVWD